jgi:hypothetical protein
MTNPTCIGLRTRSSSTSPFFLTTLLIIHADTGVPMYIIHSSNFCSSLGNRNACAPTRHTIQIAGHKASTKKRYSIVLQTASFLTSIYSKSGALLWTSRPMMRPKRPRIELKISMTRIFTNLHLVSCIGKESAAWHTVQGLQRLPGRHCFR